MNRNPRLAPTLAVCALLLAPAQGGASSHREAPFITENPKVDGTDFYMFRSYESGRSEFVTLIANYLPLQDGYGGPNFFTLDPDALYEIHIDNNGDAQEDLTFQFRFQNTLANGGAGVAIPVGPADGGKMVAVPLANVGAISASDASNLNVVERYTVTLVRGNRRTGTTSAVTNVSTGSTTFRKPVDNIGSKSIPAYAAYAAAHVYEIAIPGCTPPSGKNARVFVGQRADGFAVNLGQIFDLVNVKVSGSGGIGEPVNVLGDRDQGANTLDGKNVTSIALEVPIACLTASAENAQTTIGAWTTASLRQARVLNRNATYTTPAREGGAWTQVSRLGMPLVNEVVIGLKDKDRFNGSHPSGDTQFIDYVTHPTLPTLLQILFSSVGVMAPTQYPRTDLVAAFLTGVPSVNQTATPSEMLRLNTALPATPKASQNSLGAAACFVHGTLTLSHEGCDPAGFPNGRRPGDDVVDVALRVVMGYLLPEAVAPSGSLPLTDGALNEAAQFPDAFPYLNTPFPGSP